MRYLLHVLLLLFLVAGCGPSSSVQEETGPSNDRANWKKLSRGMTEDKVRDILGEPVQVETQDDVTCWHYRPGPPLERYDNEPDRWIVARGAVLFSRRGADALKVTEWREP
jgi:hypothetical protein